MLTEGLLYLEDCDREIGGLFEAERALNIGATGVLKCRANLEQL
jgi:hypothetical protein